MSSHATAQSLGKDWATARHGARPRKTQRPKTNWMPCYYNLPYVRTASGGDGGIGARRRRSAWRRSRRLSVQPPQTFFHGERRRAPCRSRGVGGDFVRSLRQASLSPSRRGPAPKLITVAAVRSAAPGGGGRRSGIQGTSWLRPRLCARNYEWTGQDHRINVLDNGAGVVGWPQANRQDFLAARLSLDAGLHTHHRKLRGSAPACTKKKITPPRVVDPWVPVGPPTGPCQLPGCASRSCRWAFFFAWLAGWLAGLGTIAAGRRSCSIVTISQFPSECCPGVCKARFCGHPRTLRSRSINQDATSARRIAWKLAYRGLIMPTSTAMVAHHQPSHKPTRACQFPQSPPLPRWAQNPEACPSPHSPFPSWQPLAKPRDRASARRRNKKRAEKGKDIALRPRPASQRGVHHRRPSWF